MLKIDKDIDIKPKSWEILVMLLTQIAAECWIAVLTPMDMSHVQVWVQSQIFIILFEVQQFVDNKIQQIYDILTEIVIGYTIINLIDTYLNFKSQGIQLITVDKIVPILVILLVLMFITAKRGLGAGDFLIYIALQIHYLTYQDNPWFIMAISLFIGEALFLIFNALDSIINKDMHKHRPFTVFLQIAAIFTFA